MYFRARSAWLVPGPEATTARYSPASVVVLVHQVVDLA